MKPGTILLVLAVSSLAASGCRKCYTCTVQTDFGKVKRQVCGRKGDIQGLINSLESDTTGNGPWQCE